MLLLNDVFKGDDGVQYRVLDTGSTPGEGWIIPVTTKRNWPVFRNFGVLRAHMQKKMANQPALSLYSEATRKRAAEALDAIKPLLSSPDIFHAQERGKLVKARAEELGISKTTLIKYLRQYWVNGQSLLALVPSFVNIGRCQNGRELLRWREDVVMGWLPGRASRKIGCGEAAALK